MGEGRDFGKRSGEDIECIIFYILPKMREWIRVKKCVQDVDFLKTYKMPKSYIEFVELFAKKEQKSSFLALFLV